MRWRALALVVAATFGARAEAADSGVDEYYAWANLKAVPIRLSERLAKSETERRRAFYVAARDEQGRLMRVTKMLDGKVFFEHEYVYDSKGNLIERRVTNHEGVTRTSRRDNAGKFK